MYHFTPNQKGVLVTDWRFCNFGFGVLTVGLTLHYHCQMGKITPQQKTEILALYKDGVCVTSIANQYGVSECYPGVLAKRAGMPLRTIVSWSPKDPEIDWQDMFKRYMAHVSMNEGTTFLPDWDSPFEGGRAISGHLSEKRYAEFSAFVDEVHAALSTQAQSYFLRDVEERGA